MKKTIILLLCVMLCALCMNISATNSKTDANLVGHVIDAMTGEHLPFVTIQLKGTSIGAVSGASGHFLLTNLPVGETTLIFSMVGYKTIEASLLLEAGKTCEINIAMEEESLLIDAVVVTANKYETKKCEATTIVNVISPLLIESTASNTMSDVLDFQTGVRVEM